MSEALTGIVTLVHGNRFQLVDDRGVGHLLLVAAHGDIDASTLADVARERARVTVISHPEAFGLVARVATKLERA